MVLDTYGLGPERSYNEITYAEFQEVHRQYSPTLPISDPYENFEDLRLNTIPATLRQRQADGCVFLEKVELQILGEYRRKQPPGLITKAMCRTLADNSIEDIRRYTMEAFLLYGERRNYSQALEKLMKLNGVSLCIATLVLSLFDPANIPYFSEGLYRWCREDDSRNGTWNRQLDYHLKQYKDLLAKVAQFRGRMKADSGVDVTALEVEQVARQMTEWALYRRRKRPRAEDDDYLLKPLEKRDMVPFGTAEHAQALKESPARKGGEHSTHIPLYGSEHLPNTPEARSTATRTLIACDACRRSKRRCNHDVPPQIVGIKGKIGRPRKNQPRITPNGTISGPELANPSTPAHPPPQTPSQPYPQVMPGASPGPPYPPPGSLPGRSPYPPPGSIPGQIPYPLPGSAPPQPPYPLHPQMTSQTGSFSANRPPNPQAASFQTNLQHPPPASPALGQRSSTFPLPDPHAAIREALAAWQSKQ